MPVTCGAPPAPGLSLGGAEHREPRQELRARLSEGWSRGWELRGCQSQRLLFCRWRCLFVFLT